MGSQDRDPLLWAWGMVMADASKFQEGSSDPKQLERGVAKDAQLRWSHTSSGQVARLVKMSSVYSKL